MKNKIKSPACCGGKEGGFLQIIIIIIIALLIMKYFGITISAVVDWFLSFFRSVLR